MSAITATGTTNPTKTTKLDVSCASCNSWFNGITEA